MVQTQTGFVFSPELQTGILGLVNLALRLVTNEAVGLHDDGQIPPSPPFSKGGDGSGPFPGLNGGTAADLKPKGEG
jgi:hypothetical protein